MATKYRLAVDRVLVDRGDHAEQYVRGDALDTVPESTIVNMVRVGQAVPESDYQAPAADANLGSAEWLDTPTGALGLSGPAFKVLNAANLRTVRDVLAYGAKHGSLTEIKGVGQATEVEVQAAIERLNDEQTAQQGPAGSGTDQSS